MRSVDLVSNLSDKRHSELQSQNRWSTAVMQLHILKKSKVRNVSQLSQTLRQQCPPSLWCLQLEPVFTVNSKGASPETRNLFRELLLSHPLMILAQFVQSSNSRCDGHCRDREVPRTKNVLHFSSKLMKAASRSSNSILGGVSSWWLFISKSFFFFLFLIAS